MHSIQGEKDILTNVAGVHHILSMSKDGDFMEYRMDQQVKALLECAKQEARDMGNNYIGSEHILLALMKDIHTPLSRILSAQGMYYFQLKEDLMILFGLKDQSIGEIQMTQIVENMMGAAEKLAEERNQRQLSVEVVSIALLKSGSCVANEILHRYDLDEEVLLLQLENGLISELDKYSELRNLNRTEGYADIVGRKEELDFMVSVLLRKDKANPLLVGEAGVGKTALVEQLARDIRYKKIKGLEDIQIYELNLNALVAGTKYRGDFEEKLQKIIRLLQKYPEVILFIDEIHQMIGAGKSEGSIDVASVLKPYLARGSIRCIGATTLEEYEKYIEKDRALERRFQIIHIQEPSLEQVYTMLEAKQKEYESFHHVSVCEEALRCIVHCCNCYIPQRKFPDKAIDVLDLACVETKKQQQTNVDKIMIQKVIEQLTDIPLVSYNRFHYVKEELQKRVIGQSTVVAKLLKQLAWIEQGVLTDKPLGVWLFLGNAHVGKEYVIDVFNRCYFHCEERVEINAIGMEGTLEHALVKLRRKPYSLVQISNLHLANEATLLFFQQAFQKGYIWHGNQKVDLRHSIIILQGDFDITQENILHFQPQDPYIGLKKRLGEAFLEVIDEIFLFSDLQVEDKIQIVKEIVRKWNIPLQDTLLKESVKRTKTIDEAIQLLKSKWIDNFGEAHINEKNT